MVSILRSLARRSSVGQEVKLFILPKPPYIILNNRPNALSRGPKEPMGFERAASIKPAPLIDPFQRAITYLRVSVTDRCDFRCVYCMSENMTFLPKPDLLTLEELDRLCSAFVARGVR